MKKAGKCEVCGREMKKVYPVYDTKTGGYIFMCHKDMMLFLIKRECEGLI